MLDRISLLFILIVTLILSLFESVKSKLQTNLFHQRNTAEETPSIPIINVTIYAPGTSCVEITDESYPTEYEIPHEEGQTYSIVGKTVKVDSKTGLVTCIYETTYWYGGGGYPKIVDIYGEPDYIQKEYEIGLTTVTVQKNGETIAIYGIDVVDYNEILAKKKIDEFMTGIISSTSKTDYEKLQSIVEFVANRQLDIYHGKVSEVVNCNVGASSGIIKTICDLSSLCGFNCHTRYGLNDTGKESEKSSFTAAVLLKSGDIVYNCDAGWKEPDPQGRTERKYTIIPQNVGWLYKKDNNNDLIISHYDGFEHNLVVPDKIDDFTVKALGYQCFTYTVVTSKNPINTLQLPESLEVIGDRAFYQVNSLDELKIPKNVNTIGYMAFYNMENFSKFEVDEENQNFLSENGVLFTKDKKSLLYYPTGKSGKYIMPEGTINIKDYAFFNLTKTEVVYIASTVESLGNYAFGSSVVLKEIHFESNNVPQISKNAFNKLNVTVYYHKANEEWAKWANSTEQYGAKAILKKEWVDKSDPEEKEQEEQKEKEGEDGGESGSNTWVVVVIILTVIIVLFGVFIIYRKCNRNKPSISTIEKAQDIGLSNN